MFFTSCLLDQDGDDILACAPATDLACPEEQSSRPQSYTNTYIIFDLYNKFTCTDTKSKIHGPELKKNRRIDASQEICYEANVGGVLSIIIPGLKPGFHITHSKRRERTWDNAILSHRNRRYFNRSHLLGS